MFLKLFFLLVIYINIVDQWFPVFSYFDEASTLFLIFIAFLQICLNSKQHTVLTKTDIVILVLSIFLLCIGIVSSYSSFVKNTYFLQIYTLFANFKFILLYFCTKIIFSNIPENKVSKLSKFLLKQSYVFSYLFIFIYLINFLGNFMIVYSVRFGMNNYSYGFGHPGEFASIVILQTTINLYFNMKFKGKIDALYLILNTILLVTAGRTTSIGFILMLFVLIYSYRYFRKYVFGGIVVSGIIIVMFSYQKIIETLLSENQPRGILLSTAIKIANDFFPLGSGLGTFGSNASSINYSQIYYIYGISNKFGLSPDYFPFITDSYWAMIIGENGFLAAFLILCIFILILIKSYNKNKGIVGLFISIPILYLLLSSPIDTVIVSNIILGYMVIFGFILNNDQKLPPLIKKNK